MLIRPEILVRAELGGYSVWIEGENLKYKYVGIDLIQSSDAKEIIKELSKNKPVVYEYLRGINQLYENMLAVDIETTGLNPYKLDIRLISWADKDGGHVSETVDDISLKLQDENILKVFHYASFDVPFLIQKGYKVNNYTDSMVMSQIISGKNEQHSLKEVAKRELGIELDKSMQGYKNWLDILTKEHIEYSKQDAEITYEVAKSLLKKIQDNGQMPELIRNQEALPFTIRCKVDGIYFDRDGWSKELADSIKQKDDLEVSILSELGTKINLNAPNQVKQVLVNRGLELPDTKNETLAALEHVDPIIKNIRKYRAVQKLVTSTGEKLLSHIDRDGRVRSDWKIHGAVTGRMSCSGPNIQQMDKNIKPYFKAEEGNILIDCDYSQIELRVVAQISGDKEMLDAFNKKEDLHMKTAKMLFGNSEIGKRERQIAKTCNFGLIYGMSAEGLKKRLKETCDMDVSIREAELFRERFFCLYKGVKKWQIKSYNKSEISTLGGRKWKSRSLSSLEKYNYPIQGTAAEGLKVAMSIIIREIPDNWKICAVIHDEVLLEVPLAEEETAKEKLEQWMVQGMCNILSKVPIVAESSSSFVWEKA